MRYLVDTSLISAIHRREAGFERVVDRIETAKRGTLLMSSMTALELWYGAAGSKTPKAARLVLESLIKAVRVVPLESVTARLAFDVHLALIRAGKGIGKEDALIAAHALHLGAVCATANVKHFERIPKLIVENWLRAR